MKTTNQAGHYYVARSQRPPQKYVSHLQTTSYILPAQKSVQEGNGNCWLAAAVAVAVAAAAAVVVGGGAVGAVGAVGVVGAVGAVSAVGVVGAVGAVGPAVAAVDAVAVVVVVVVAAAAGVVVVVVVVYCRLDRVDNHVASKQIVKANSWDCSGVRYGSDNGICCFNMFKQWHLKTF